MKKFILVTGGAGFVGSNLISLLLKKTNYKILSLDNYSTGSKKITLIQMSEIYKGDTSNINNKLKTYKKNFQLFFIWRVFKNISKL